jgi:CubicO group peptidase (beta-lactamase class C family)
MLLPILTAIREPPPEPWPVAAGEAGDGRLATILASARNHYELPALGAVLVKDGQILELATTGRRVATSTTRVTDSDAWHIGSLTKAMTGTLAGILVEEGLLTWDTTPADVWPDDASTLNPQLRQASLADFLAHQSGIGNDIFDVPSIALIVDGAPGTVTEKRSLWAKELLQQTPVGPNSEYFYSNAGYIVAGAMLEAITGADWESLTDSRLFQPLGMGRSGFGAPGSPGLPPTAPWGHSRGAGDSGLEPVAPGPGSDNIVALGPAGTVHTPLGDYARFMHLHLRAAGVNLLSESTLDFLQAPYRGVGYGMGWILFNDARWAGFGLGHDGSNTLWRARVLLIPSLGAGFLLVTNVNVEPPVAFDAIQDLLITRLLSAP